MDSTLSRASLPEVRYGSLSRRVVLGGVLLAGACVLGLLEASIASPVPGVRLGLANIAVIVAFVTVGRRSALAVTLLRVVVVGLATGALLGPVSALAFAGAAASWLAMAFALKSRFGFSLIGVSVAGASAHVLAQFIAAAALTSAPGVLRLAPYALLVSLLFGIATGFAARSVVSRLKGTVLTGN